MEKKYSVHKLWFYYTDEWYCPRGLGPSIGTYPTVETAGDEARRLDRIALMNMATYDIIRDLTHFYEKNYDATIKELVAYAKLQNWDEFIKQHPYSNAPESHYYELFLPKTATSEQLNEILRITNTSFHRIIEYKDVTEYKYVQTNYEFWGKKAMDKLKEDGIAETRNPTIDAKTQRGYYLIGKSAKNRKSAKLPVTADTRKMAARAFIEGIKASPDKCFLGKTYVGQWSSEPDILLAYLSGCQSIKLTATVVDAGNLKSLAAVYKKKTGQKLEAGMIYYDVTFDDFDEANTEEILGFTELLKIWTFKTFTILAEINGETVNDFMDESALF